MGNYNKAIVWYKKMLPPRDEEAAQNNIRTYADFTDEIRSLEDDPELREKLRATLQGIQEVSSTYDAIGQAYMEEKNYSEALAWFEKSLAIHRVLDVPKEWDWAAERTKKFAAECRGK
jgi:tetratricopeptide (TPR) repeat protein